MQDWFEKKILLIFLCFGGIVFSQTSNTNFSLSTHLLVGNVLPHTNQLNHLITGHPEGIMVSISKETNGKNEWEKIFNYPDYGLYFLHQDFKNEFLGENYALGLHYNFYFLSRTIQLKTAGGIAYATSPYDKVSNSKNNSFGTRFLSNLNIGLAYKKNDIVNNFGFEAGFLLTHFSNGRIKSPNSGINTLNLNLGLNYSFKTSNTTTPEISKIIPDYKKAIQYNFVLRTGINESDIINSGQYPFYHVGFFVDKRISKKSGLQLGTELFLSQYNKDFIKYQSVAYPEENLNPNTDYKRAGIFVGHELFINRLSFETQIGYYIYQPYKFNIPVYDRLGLKYYINKNLFTGLSLKTHMFLAEALEVVIGVKI